MCNSFDAVHQVNKQHTVTGLSAGIVLRMFGWQRIEVVHGGEYESKARFPVSLLKDRSIFNVAIDQDRPSAVGVIRNVEIKRIAKVLLLASRERLDCVLKNLTLVAKIRIVSNDSKGYGIRPFFDYPRHSSPLIATLKEHADGNALSRERSVDSSGARLQFQINNNPRSLCVNDGASVIASGVSRLFSKFRLVFNSLQASSGDLGSPESDANECKAYQIAYPIARLLVGMFCLFWG